MFVEIRYHYIMDQEIYNKIESLEAKIDEISVSVNKTQKYFKMTFWITVALVVVPAIALMFAIPTFISLLTTDLNSLIQI